MSALLPQILQTEVVENSAEQAGGWIEERVRLHPSHNQFGGPDPVRVLVFGR
jgi:hypothetical protein